MAERLKPSAAMLAPTSRPPAPKKTRMSARVRAAVQAMVEDGLSRADAAAKAGLEDNSLYKALRRPDVCAYRNDLMRALRESEASRSISRVAKLADTAESEHVRLESNKWLGGIEGVSPVSRSESVYHVHSTQPGLQIVFLEAPAAPAIEGTASRVEEAPEATAFPEPVPHPALAQRRDNERK